MATMTTKVERPSAQEIQYQQRSLWGDAVRRFLRNRLAVFGLVIVLFFLFLAVFADIIAPYPYDQAHFTSTLRFPLQEPGFILGTDEIGRDYLSRLIYGARTSMTIGLVVQVIAFGIGVPLGAIAGLRGGVTDFVVMRVVDVMTAFPGLLLAILLVAVWGGGMWKVIAILGFTSWVGVTRITRAQMLTLREKEYVEAARGIGAKEGRIIVKHLLPNALTPLLVALSFGIPGAIFGEAGLSFMGIGINDPVASWGKMVGMSTSYVRVYWYLALFPTLLIALTMLGFSFVGDGLRDALDPRLLE
ncbi:MAG: ABC transporter permease [Anaerolineae bacterium]|nr:ABC transporter permease [Anaerolineae bacterium]